MKRILSALLISSMLLIAFAGCSSTKPASGTANSSGDSSAVESSLTDDSSTATTTAATTSSADSKATTTAATKSASQSVTPKKGNTYTAPANLTGTVTFSGSTSVYPVAAALTEAFKKKNPNVIIRIDNVTGSGAGLTDANAGKVSFGMRSSAWDSVSASANPKIKTFQIALDGVAIVVNPNNSTGVTNMSLLDIYNNFGGASGKVSGPFSNPIIREDGSGTRTCFQDILKGSADTGKKAPTYPSGIETEASTQAVENAVASNVNAIGYMSLGAVNSSVKKLTVNGVSATQDNVINGTYPFSRPFLLLHNTDKALSNAEKEFLKFSLSTEGQQIINSCGYIALSSGQLTNEITKIQ